MQEKPLYAAILAELTDDEFIEIVGRGIRDRGRTGIVLLLGGAGEHTIAATAFPDDVGMKGLPLAHQLKVLAMYCSLGVSEINRTAED